MNNLILRTFDVTHRVKFDSYSTNIATTNSFKSTFLRTIDSSAFMIFIQKKPSCPEFFASAQSAHK